MSSRARVSTLEFHTGHRAPKHAHGSVVKKGAIFPVFQCPVLATPVGLAGTGKEMGFMTTFLISISNDRRRHGFSLICLAIQSFHAYLAAFRQGVSVRNLTLSLFVSLALLTSPPLATAANYQIDNILITGSGGFVGVGFPDINNSGQLAFEADRPANGMYTATIASGPHLVVDNSGSFSSFSTPIINQQGARLRRRNRSRYSRSVHEQWLDLHNDCQRFRSVRIV